MTTPSPSPLTLNSILPVPLNKQPRCGTLYLDNSLTLGFADGSISTLERESPSDPFTPNEDTSVKLTTNIIFGLNRVPEGHEMYAETSLLVGAGDKALRNVLTDGTELFTISPATHPTISHTGTVENIVFAHDAKKTLITAGWDGLIKFWSGDECIMSISIKSQYSTQISLFNADLIAVGSGSKILSLVKVDFDKMYSFYEETKLELEQNDNDDNTMNDNPAPKTAMINEQTALKEKNCQIL